MFNIQDFKYAVEIGAGDYNGCYLLQNESFRSIFQKIDIYEPNSLLFQDINSRIVRYGGLNIYNEVISNKNETKIFYSIGLSSFLQGSQSFLNLAHDENPEEYLVKFAKPVRTLDFCELDNGNIDYLSLTANGCELDILQRMNSKPKIIRTTFMIHNAKHQSYFQKTVDYLARIGYKGYCRKTNKQQTFFELEFIKNG